MIKLGVELGERSYPIFIGESILNKLGEICRLYGYGKKAIAITDKRVARHHGDRLRSSLQSEIDALEVITVPSGEKSKTLTTAAKILTQMLESGCERNSSVIAFGGGVIGDLAGFVASIFKRGVNLIQVPTTLLAQVDSSIGGKTGVNHPLGKNMIGTFYQPNLVWIDLALLSTLPKREVACGAGEIVKYAIIRDRELFELLESKLDDVLNLEPATIEDIVKRCCEIKSEIVAADEREGSLRMILNFGHTVGHALEAAFGYKQMAHGEAVLLGILAESRVALDAGLLSNEEFQRIQGLVDRFGLAQKLRKMDLGVLVEFMRKDKKVLEERIRFVLPRAIGEVTVVDGIEPDAIRTALAYLIEPR